MRWAEACLLPRIRNDGSLRARILPERGGSVPMPGASLGLRREKRYSALAMETSTAAGFSSTRALLSMAALVVIIYGLQAAQAILVPFLVSAFLAMLCVPIMRALERLRVPSGLAVVLVVLLMIGSLVAVALFLGGSIGEFRDRAPFYEQRLNEQLTGLAARFGQEEVTMAGLLDGIQPGAAMGLVSTILDSLRQLLANFFLIIFFLIFLLLEASTFPDKLRVVMAESAQDPAYFSRFTQGVQRYLGIKTAVSLATGFAVAVMTALLDIDFPMLWGLLAFLFNYVPNIGSLIAAVPAVMLGFVQLGFGTALLLSAGYLVINVVIGGIVEPRVMGHGLGLSTLVVFASLVFWGWVFGPVGMLLSVPLTMTAKIALESSPSTAWASMLLGNAAQVRPAKS
jgi:AI-2 transport protein TqsA